MAQADLQNIPLLYSFRQLVQGNGFLAGVRMEGRALLEIESTAASDEFWFTGIAPVGITGGGRDRGTAYVEFRKAWAEVIFDLAEEASSFAAFKASCEAFLASNQESLTALWRGAVEAVRQQNYRDPSLPTGDADRPPSFEVVQLTRFGTAGNQVDNGVLVAA